jgi:hypothetical protein
MRRAAFLRSAWVVDAEIYRSARRSRAAAGSPSIDADADPGAPAGRVVREVTDHGEAFDDSDEDGWTGHAEMGLQDGRDDVHVGVVQARRHFGGRQRVLEGIPRRLEAREILRQHPVPALAGQVAIGKEVLPDRPDLECRDHSLDQRRVRSLGVPPGDRRSGGTPGRRRGRVVGGEPPEECQGGSEPRVDPCLGGSRQHRVHGRSDGDPRSQKLGQSDGDFQAVGKAPVIGSHHPGVTGRA